MLILNFASPTLVSPMPSTLYIGHSIVTHDARKPFDLDGTTSYADAQIGLDEVSASHDMRVFSATDAVFKEYDQSARRWFDINYDTIIPPR